MGGGVQSGPFFPSNRGLQFVYKWEMEHHFQIRFNNIKQKAGIVQLLPSQGKFIVSEKAETKTKTKTTRGLVLYLLVCK